MIGENPWCEEFARVGDIRQNARAVDSKSIDNYLSNDSILTGAEEQTKQKDDFGIGGRICRIRVEDILTRYKMLQP